MLENFTEQDKKTLRYGLLSTWDVIGHDVLDLSGEPIDRDEVIEVVLDADHPLTQGFVHEDLWNKFTDLPSDEQDEFARTVFTCELYGY